MRHVIFCIVTTIALPSNIPTAGNAAAQELHTKPIYIHIGPRNRCWYYDGKLDGFEYIAKENDSILITASGEAHFSDGVNMWAEVKPRDIFVSDADNKIVKPDKSGSIYKFKSAGDYHIVLGPVAIEKMRSMLIVCRAPPGTAVGG